MKVYAGRVLMLVENRFPADTRVSNEASTLARNGYKVTVIALRGRSETAREVVNGVTVYRIPPLTLFKKLPGAEPSGIRALANKVRILVGYVSEYIYFTGACLILSLYVAAREGFDVIHAHNPPDTLFVVGGVHKLFGKKFVFDHHDLSPELYRSRYKTAGGLIARCLGLFEKASLKLADVAIVTNESYRDIDIQRSGLNPDKVFIVRNGPDLQRVRLTEPDQSLRRRGRIILGYVGAMNPQDGVDYLLRALGHLLHTLKRSDFHCVLIGDGDSMEELIALSVELGLSDHVTFTGFIDDESLVRYLSTADICLDPNPTSPLNDVSTWIKVMEYMALGKPVVSFDLKETRKSAADAALYVRPDDEVEFATAIARLMDDAALRLSMGERGRARVNELLNWDITSRNLLEAYRRLFPMVPAKGQRQPLVRIPTERIGH
jgi:glycosyltransferase involved in cell wall biosynthesis